MPTLAPHMPEKLAESAFALFSEKGINNVNLDAVAARAGVTKGSLYHHYGCKKELVIAACNHYYRRWRENIDAELAPLADPLERLEKVVESSVRSCIMDPRNRIFTTEVWALSISDEDIRAGWARFYDAVRELYIGLLEAVADAGLVGAGDPRRAVNLMLTALEGVKQRALFEPAICNPADQRAIIEDLMRILGAPPPKGV